MSVVVVLPTYDERENIEAVVRAVLARPCHPDVLVVDDSSPDGTADLVRALVPAAHGRLELLVRPSKQGLGRAYAGAFRHVLDAGRHDVVVQMDVDGSHRPEDLDRLVAALDDAGLALGSRYVRGGRVVGWPWYRQALSRGGNYYARALLGLPLSDLTGGFKAWRAATLRAVDTDSTDSGGYAFQVETTLRAVRLGTVVVEVPVVFADRQLGRSKMSGSIALEALSAVPRLRREHPVRLHR